MERTCNRLQLRTFCFASTALVSSMLVMSPIWAQETIETIVVTANKTSSLETKTPISMTVISESKIASMGIADVQSLTQKMPDLNFADVGGEGYIALRGVSSQNLTETGDPAVPIAVDGFALNRPFTIQNAMFDVSRIEVLRGPQGTLYGRNSIGGAVNIYTADPGKELGGYGQLTLGDYQTLRAEGAFNIPVSDRFQMRASFMSTHHDGYIDNGAQGRGNSEDSLSGRVKIALQPIDHLSILASAEFTHVGGTSITDYVLPFTFSEGNSPDPDHHAIDYGDGHHFAVTFQPEQVITDRQFRWQVSYDDLPLGVTATYVGGYDDVQWHHLMNAAWPVTPPTPLSLTAYNQNENPKTMSHELRFASPTDQRLSWQVGGNWFLELDPNLDSHIDRDYAGSQFVNVVFFKYKTKDTSLAGFGQASFKLTDELSISAGLRYTTDHKTETGVFRPPFGTAAPIVPHDGSWSKLTWHGGVDWNPTDHNLVYFKVDKGYKNGGFTGNTTYNPETVTTFELGTKNRFFDNTVSMNLAGFYSDYKDQQVTELVPVTATSTGTLIQNAGASEIYGIELSGEALLGEFGRADLSFSWLHARFTKFFASNGVGSAVPGSCATVCNYNWDLKGYSLANSPDISLSAGFEHSWEITEESSLTARIETKYQSEQFFSFFDYPDSRMGPYTVSNFFLRYDTGKWEIEGYIKNLEDSTVLVEANETYTRNDYRFGFAPPRTTGVRIRTRF